MDIKGKPRMMENCPEGWLGCVRRMGEMQILTTCDGVFDFDESFVLEMLRSSPENFTFQAIALSSVP
jgi:hypothetical protein